MNEYANPPCDSSLARSLINGMSSEDEKEVRRTSPFAEPGEVVEKGVLEFDEGVVERNVPLDSPFVSIQQREKKWSAFGEP